MESTSAMETKAEGYKKLFCADYTPLNEMNQGELIYLRHYCVGMLAFQAQKLSQLKEDLKNLRRDIETLQHEKTEIEKRLCPIKVIKPGKSVNASPKLDDEFINAVLKLTPEQLKEILG